MTYPHPDQQPDLHADDCPAVEGGKLRPERCNCGNFYPPAAPREQERPPCGRRIPHQLVVAEPPPGSPPGPWLKCVACGQWARP